MPSDGDSTCQLALNAVRACDDRLGRIVGARATVPDDVATVLRVEARRLMTAAELIDRALVYVS
jgi:hypothetical protein